MVSTIDPSLLLISEPIHLDAGVIVGYRPARDPKDPRLILARKPGCVLALFCTEAVALAPGWKRATML